MTDQKIIKSVFPGCGAIQALPFERIDTISGKLLGERALARYRVIDAKDKAHYIVIKRKNSLVVPLGAVELSPSFGVFVKVIYAHRIFGFNDGQKREKLFYEKVDDSMRSVLPHLLETYETLGGQSTILVMEEFSQGREVGEGDLRKIIDIITDFHARYYGKREVVQQMKLNHYTPEDYRRSRDTLKALFDYYYDENVKIYGKKLTKDVADFIDHIDAEYAEVMDHQTLTHNDFTPRNLFVDERGIIIYDWELACYQNPEHDLVELLISTIGDDFTDVQIRKIIAYYRKTLAEKTGQKISDAKFAKVMRFNALEYCVSRLAIYRSYSRHSQNSLVKKCVKNARKVLEVCR